MAKRENRIEERATLEETGLVTGDAQGADEADESENGSTPDRIVPAGAFDIADYPLLRLKKVSSKIQTMSSFGMTSKVLNGEDSSVSPEFVQRARDFLYENYGDKARQEPRFTAIKLGKLRVYPTIRTEVYSDLDKLQLAIPEWIRAIEAFNVATVAVGKQDTYDISSYYADGGQRISGTEVNIPASPTAILKSAIEKGVSLVHQADSYVNDVMPVAEESAKAAGFRPLTKTKRQRVEKEEEEG